MSNHVNVATLSNACDEFAAATEAAIDGLRRTIEADREKAAEAVAQTRDEVVAEMRRVDEELSRAIVTTARAIVSAAEPLRRGFWGRLTWLLLGR